LTQLWSDLTDDEGHWYQAAWSFGTQEETLAFLREQLPVEASDEKRFRALLADLSDKSIEKRQSAQTTFEESPIHLDGLRKASKEASDVEIRTRIEMIVKSWENELIREARRRARAIMALEWMRSEASLLILEDIAKKSPIERERLEAVAALKRCRR
jgi:hypothetical protein